MAMTGTRTASRAARPSFLPPGAGAFVRRRVSEFTGVALILSGLLLLAALLTYHPDDPSWNTAGATGPVRNVLGAAGAVVADLTVQMLGLAGFLGGVALTVWGWRLVRHRPMGRVWVRVLALLLALPLTAIALTPLPAFEAWQSGATLGGAVGMLLVERIDSGAQVTAGAADSGWLALGAGGVALLAWLLAVGMSTAEWRDLGALLARVARLAWNGTAAAVRTGWRRTQAAAVAVAAIAAEFSRRDPAPVPSTEPVFARSAGRRAAAAPDEPGGAGSRLAGAADPPRPRAEPVVAPRPKPIALGRRAAASERQGGLELDPAEGGAEPYALPPLELLSLPDPAKRPVQMAEDALRETAEMLTGVLGDFGVRGEIVKVNPGPVVTLYELEPAPGTKSSRVIGLADDIARSMSAVSVRVAVVPGRNVIGIELPNARREMVYLRELLSAEAYEKANYRLALVLGKDIGGTAMIADLARMPHLLVAGTTGSGKSVAINTMILSLLYRLRPEQVKFIMVDPKMLELSVYDGIPHLLSPVVTDPKKAVVALKWTVREMEERYRAMSKLGVRNIEGYNQRLREARDKGEVLTRRVQTGFDADTGKPVFEEQPLDLTELPYIVVVVDEMADLMLVAGKDIEAAIQRLAQMARAAGIHLIMATQRPSVDVITGTIKANFPTRISFQVTSKIDSRTILGESGGEQLLGQGDMLYMAGGGRITRVHGPFVSDAEVEQVVRFLKTQGEPNYNDSVLEEEEEGGGDPAGSGGAEGGTGDDLYDQAVALVARERKASTSFIQRHLQIGYNRAARLIERMEVEGVVSSANHVGKREVLVRKPDADL